MGARSVIDITWLGPICTGNLEELANGSTNSTASAEVSTIAGDEGETGRSEVSIDADEGRENTDFANGFSDPTTDEMGV